MLVRPKSYYLQFEIDTVSCIFKGFEKIILSVVTPGRQFELDANDLKIHSCILVSKQNKIAVAFTLKKSASKLIIRIPKSVPKGEYELHISFEGILNDNLAGLYRSRYIHNGEEKFMATTQFEAAEAKRAFPCFDHPSMKAVFHVSMIIDQKLTAISNTLIKKQKILNDGKKQLDFHPTPLMSTYLLYLGVGEFELIEDMRKNTLVRIITLPGKSKHGEFALDFAKKCLDYFENYFKAPYPLKKLDLIAVPDFAAGAMENWGAIAFRETALLYYAKTSSIQNKQRVAEVIAHEIAHMWFGNLVTMKWWDDLWLNESFATFMAYKAVDFYFPKWRVWEEYITDTVFGGMALDALKSSHPIHVPIKTTEEIDEIFDEISYDKGGSILRMLEGFLGDDLFRDGLRHYIKKFAYGNTTREDLWESLETVSKIKVKRLMSKFIDQIGFPQISVSNEKNNLLLKQSRFLFEDEKRSKPMVWDIPLVITDSTDRTERVMMTKNSMKVELESKGDFAYINRQYDGFFITDYDKESLQELGSAVHGLSTEDVLGLIHDIFALVLAGKKDLTTALKYIATFFAAIENATIQTYIVRKTLGLYLLVESTFTKEMAVDFAKRAIKQIGFEPKKNEDTQITALRNAALFSLSFFDEEQTGEFFEKKFDAFLKDSETLHSDLRTITYSAVVWGDKSKYDVIKKLYEESDIQEEKTKLLMALTNVKDTALLKKTLEYSLTSQVRFANILYVIFGACRNPYGKKITFEWLQKNWDELKKRTGGHANSLLRRIVKSIIPECVGFEKHAESFLKKNPVRGLERSYEQALEELRINSKFVASNS